MINKEEFTLTAEDRESRLWKKLMAHFSEQLDTMRINNDSDICELGTAKVRGRIAMLKSIMALNEPPKPIDELMF